MHRLGEYPRPVSPTNFTSKTSLSERFQDATSDVPYCFLAPSQKRPPVTILIGSRLVNNRESIRRAAPFPRHKAGPHDFSTPCAASPLEDNNGGMNGPRCVPRLRASITTRVNWRRDFPPVFFDDLAIPESIFSLFFFFLCVRWSGRKGRRIKINCISGKILFYAK